MKKALTELHVIPESEYAYKLILKSNGQNTFICLMFDCVVLEL